jgi:hypothetical protein
VGSFYTNISLRTTDRAAVRSRLTSRGLTAYLARPEDGTLVVFERQSEEQDPAVLQKLASDLSAVCSCAALAVMNHDDSVLLYWLFEAGKLVDEYDSAPEYFSSGGKGATRGGKPETLTAAFGVPDRASQVAAILGLASAGGADDVVVFETDRHARLVEALGLPLCAVATGFTYLEAGEIPPGYDAGNFDLVGGA